MNKNYTNNFNFEPQKKYSILLVDDEEENLILLSFFLKSDYEVVTAKSGKEAIDYLKSRKFDIIITDQRMPDINGTEVLEESLSLQPECIRIILSAYSDINAVLNAVNKGAVYRFIIKPYQHEEIKSIISQALEKKELQRKNQELMQKLQEKNKELELYCRQLKETQDKLIYSEKLAVLGKMASSIVHEMRNQIFFLQVFSDISLSTERDIRDKIKETQAQIKYAIQNMLRLINDISEYAKLGKIECKKEFYNIKSLIQGTIDFCKHDVDFKYRSIKTELNEVPDIFIDPLKIQQVIINILKNSVEATKKRGEIIIKLNSTSENVIITISDNGCGIPKENMDKIWQPFFSTKGERGVGLGLEICKRIIEEHKGSISCESEVGKGTTFYIFLPINPQ